MVAVGMFIFGVLAAATGVYAFFQAQKARELAQQANDLSQQLDAQRKGIESIRSETSELSRKQQERIDQLLGQLASNESTSTADRKRLDAIMAENEANKKRLSTLNTNANAYTQQVSIPSSKELTDLRDQLQRALAQNAAYERQLKSGQNDSTSMRSERDTARSERDAALADVKRLTDELRLARVEIDRLNAEVARLRRSDNNPNQTQEQLGGDFRSLYQNAMNMFDRQQWKQAATGFAAAARVQDDSTDTLAIGGRRVPYLPSFYLGLSYRQMGQCAQAVQAWDRSEKLGVIKSDSREYKAMQDGRAACQGKY
jgi:chromosome segregation ATPase